MAATQEPKERAPRRQWPPAEKRRIVELTLRGGMSVSAIAREHGVHPTSVNHWKTLYRAGKLDAQAKSLVLASGATLRIETGALDAEFVCALVAELRR